MNLFTIFRNTFTAQASAAPCNETCPSCNQRFHCGASLRGCWCAEVQLTDAQRAALRERYPTNRCLCRACLEKGL